MAGTGPIAQAAMVENEGEEQRGDALSQFVLVNCLALVTGPAVGGLLGHLDFRAPLGVALVLCAVAFAWIARSRFAESPRRKQLQFGWRRPFQIFAAAWWHPRIRSAALSFFLFQFGFAFYYVYIMVRMKGRTIYPPPGWACSRQRWEQASCWAVQ